MNFGLILPLYLLSLTLKYFFIVLTVLILHTEEKKGCKWHPHPQRGGVVIDTKLCLENKIKIRITASGKPQLKVTPRRK